MPFSNACRQLICTRMFAIQMYEYIYVYECTIAHKLRTLSEIKIEDGCSKQRADFTALMKTYGTFCPQLLH